MQKQDKIAYLASISLFLSIVELFIPRPLPFFRIGLANIPLLFAINYDFSSFMLLALLKGLGSSYISGNLISIFGVMSVLQSLASGLTMYSVSRLWGRHISIYGISMTGALVSTLVQIVIALLYAGRGMLVFLPPMLLISLGASIITAFLSGKLTIDDNDIVIETQESRTAILPITLMILSVFVIMLLSSPIAAALAFAAALIFQKHSGRRIRIMPHIIMLAVMLVSASLTPEGRVLFRILSFPVTEGSIIRGMTISLRLSASLALSQGFYPYITAGNRVIGKSVAAFTELINRWENTNGNIMDRIHNTLMINNAIKQNKSAVNIPIFIIISIIVILICILVCDYLFF